MEIKTWTSSDPLPEQMRWRVSFKDYERYFEAESDSFWAVIRVLFVVWKREMREKLRAKKDDYVRKLQWRNRS
jgi:hypothetical protein